VEKAAELLDNGTHLLIIDLCPPGRRDREGIHGESGRRSPARKWTLCPTNL
jgi:hypothetical protein